MSLSSKASRQIGIVLLAGIFFVTFAFSAQQKDKEYTAKILEYTTEKFFLTELVDHLPASSSVPTPLKILGHIAGAPDILDHTKDIYKYMRALDQASPRVEVFTIGPTDEGKEMIAVAVTSEENIRNLKRNREIMARLADPRNLKEIEAEQLVAKGVPIYWITGGLHSQETGSPEMMMELAYRLAVEETDFIKAIRKNLIVLMTPVLEVDGWDRSVDVYKYKKDNKGEKTLPLVYWGNYVLHDDNRDAIAIGLKLTENLLKAYFDWHPIIMHDLHESIPFLYTSTGTGPYNAWLDPITIDEWEELANVEVSEMTKRGVPGVWTHGFFDGWAVNYGFYVALFHNSIGRFYETFGGTGADTMVRSVGGQSRRAWYRPNPPLEAVKWSFRNNINYQQSALLFAFKHVAENKKKFLSDFYLKSKRSVAKARTEGPAAYVIPADNKRPLGAASLVNLLRKDGVEVHTANAEITLGKDKYPAGSYVIRMDQPYSRCADMLLDIQYYNPKDPKPYDDTGWTLGPLFNVKTIRVTDAKILDAAMALLKKDAKPEGQVLNKENAVAFAVNHNAENELATFRYTLKGVKMLTAENGFIQGDKKFNAGSFIIPKEGNSPDLVTKLEKASKELGLLVYGLPSLPSVKTHDLDAPRIALLHSWISTQDEGWFRIAFEKLSIPYTYISIQDIRDEENLRGKYDVIIFPPVGSFGKIQRIVNGIGGESPIPWKKSDKYPNLGGPDSRDDIRGGLEMKGILHLREFIEKGGLFMPLTTNASLAIDYGLVESVSVVKSKNLKVAGSVLSAAIADPLSPIIYGYERNLGVYFSGEPVLETGTKAILGDIDFEELIMGETKERPSGRGNLKDPDVIQGRPAKVEKISGAGTGIPPEYKEMFDLYMPPDLKSIRVVMRFETADKLFISGLLEGADELANRAAVIDVPLGAGHIVFFALNPMWRQETQGSFFLVFNTILNYKNLDAGRPKTSGGTK